MLTNIFSAMFGLRYVNCSLPQVGHFSGTWPGKRTSAIGGNSLFQPQEVQVSLKAGESIGISFPITDITALLLFARQ